MPTPPLNCMRLQVGPGSSPALRMKAFKANILFKVYSRMASVYEPYTCPIQHYAFSSANTRSLLAGRNLSDAAIIPFSWESLDWGDYYLNVVFRQALGHLDGMVQLAFRNFLTKGQVLQLKAAAVKWALAYARAQLANRDLLPTGCCFSKPKVLHAGGELAADGQTTRVD